jgi:hypothetical protein
MFKTTSYCNRLVTNSFNPLVTLTPITNYFNRLVNLRSCYPIIIELITNITIVKLKLKLQQLLATCSKQLIIVID